jgi:two-component system, LytTR family, response regulator
MKIRTILIDDELRGLRVLEHLAKQIPEISIIQSISDAEEALNAIQTQSPDLVIMDIHMPKMNAFEILEQISKPTFITIFVTAYSEHALKAFKFSAFDYLLKPVEEEQFLLAVRKAIQSIERSEIKTDIKTLMHNINTIKDPLSMKLCINHVNGFSIISIDDIIYCEADSCYTIFKLTNGKQIISSKTLAEYESIMDHQLFLRIHRSFLINISKVLEYKKGNGGSVVMSNNLEVEVSRRKKDEFLNRIKQIYGREE